VAKGKQATNPFYVVLVLVGILFFVTACAYGVMAFRADRLGRAAQQDAPSSGLMGFLQQRGGQVLAGELLLLGVATFAAIASDSYWSARRSSGPPQRPES
jgi:integral membrane sensor domain MASE1